jgi:hypothetical protein
MELGSKAQGPYSQQFIFIVTCKWAEQARLFHHTNQEWLARDKHSSLLSPFISYDMKYCENDSCTSKHFFSCRCKLECLSQPVTFDLI